MQCAGGLTSGLSIQECAKKELDEECGIMDDKLLLKLKLTDVVNYAQQCDDGLYREALFVFDLKLPFDFKPQNKDGEVESFFFMSIAEVYHKNFTRLVPELFTLVYISESETRVCSRVNSTRVFFNA